MCALRYAVLVYLVQQETPVPDRWNRVLLAQSDHYKEIPKGMAILNKTYPRLWVSEQPQSIRAICLEYTDQDYDRLS